MTITCGNICEFYCQNFCCLWGAPKKGIESRYLILDFGSVVDVPTLFCDPKQPSKLSAPKSQRLLRFYDCDAHRGPQKSLTISETRPSNDALQFKGAMESR